MGGERIFSRNVWISLVVVLLGVLLWWILFNYIYVASFPYEILKRATRKRQQKEQKLERKKGEKNHVKL